MTTDYTKTTAIPSLKYKYSLFKNYSHTFRVV